MSKRALGSSAISIAALLTTGCWAQITETRAEGAPRDIASEPPRRQPEKEDRDPTATASLTDDHVDVYIEVPRVCRDVSAVPTERHDVVQRKISNNAQTLNVAAAGLLLGLGALTLVVKCTPTSGSSTTSDGSCTESEQDTQRAAGYVLMGSAAIPLAVAVINAVRASDREEVVRLPDDRRAEPWQACGRAPASEREITLIVGRVRRTARTAADGRASFDLAALSPEEMGEDTPQTATISLAGAAAVTVDVGATRAAARWREQAARARSARVEAAARTRDESAWQRAAAAQCGDPTQDDVDVLMEACNRVAEYAQSFPNGIHQKEAQDALAAGRWHITQLSLEADRRKRAEEAARAHAAQAERQRAEQVHARGVAACQDGCVKRCKERADFVSCTKSCRDNCGN